MQTKAPTSAAGAQKLLYRAKVVLIVFRSGLWPGLSSLRGPHGFVLSTGITLAGGFG